MKLHERHFIFEDAKRDLNTAFSAWLGKHDLTTTEILLVLQELATQLLYSMLRQERDLK